MPNGGLTPDCVHCKRYRGSPLIDEEPYCEYHKVRLAYPIRAFCSSFVDPESDGEDWLDQELDRQQLRQDMMYVWLGGDDMELFYVPLAPLAEYATWTSERFLEEAAMLADKYHPHT
jgi:hypothetical protein